MEIEQRADGFDNWRSELPRFLKELEFSEIDPKENEVKCVQHALIVACGLVVKKVDRDKIQNLREQILDEYTALLGEDSDFVPPMGLTRERLWLVTGTTQYNGKKLWDQWLASRKILQNYLAEFRKTFPTGGPPSGQQWKDALATLRIKLDVLEQREKERKKKKDAARKAARAAAYEKAKSAADDVRAKALEDAQNAWIEQGRRHPPVEAPGVINMRREKAVAAAHTAHKAALAAALKASKAKTQDDEEAEDDDSGAGGSCRWAGIWSCNAKADCSRQSSQKSRQKAQRWPCR